MQTVQANTRGSRASSCPSSKLSCPRRSPAVPVQISCAVGVVSNDPLRVMGLRAILDSDFDLLPMTAPDALNQSGLAMMLIDAPEDDLFPMMAAFRRGRPGLRLVVLGSRLDPQYVQKVVASGAKGYLHYTGQRARSEDGTRSGG